MSKVDKYDLDGLKSKMDSIAEEVNVIYHRLATMEDISIWSSYPEIAAIGLLARDMRSIALRMKDMAKGINMLVSALMEGIEGEDVQG